MLRRRFERLGFQSGRLHRTPLPIAFCAVPHTELRNRDTAPPIRDQAAVSRLVGPVRKDPFRSNRTHRRIGTAPGRFIASTGRVEVREHRDLAVGSGIGNAPCRIAAKRTSLHGHAASEVRRVRRRSARQRPLLLPAPTGPEDAPAREAGLENLHGDVRPLPCRRRPGGDRVRGGPTGFVSIDLRTVPRQLSVRSARSFDAGLAASRARGGLRGAWR